MYLRGRGTALYACMWRVGRGSSYVTEGNGSRLHCMLVKKDGQGGALFVIVRGADCAVSDIYILGNVHILATSIVSKGSHVKRWAQTRVNDSLTF